MTRAILTIAAILAFGAVRLPIERNLAAEHHERAFARRN